MALQNFAVAASSASSMATIDFGVRPCQARFSRPQAHAGQEGAI
jgi:hypothetical protein